VRNSAQKEKERRLRICRRLRRRGAPQKAPPPPVRETEQGGKIEVALLRAFLKRTLEDDAVADRVNDLLFEHVVGGRFHPSVVAESLPGYIAELIHAAKPEDWQAVADQLIAEAREVDGEV
jgi:hypothetical protein